MKRFSHRRGAVRAAAAAFGLALSGPSFAGEAPAAPAAAQAGSAELPMRQPPMPMRRMTNKDREAAAKRREAYRAAAQAKLDAEKKLGKTAAQVAAGKGTP